MNAVEAMVLFFDHYKAVILENITRSVPVTDEMLAASYNAGTTGVIRSINKFGTKWLEGQTGLGEDQRLLREETFVYIKKLRSVISLEIFRNN